MAQYSWDFQQDTPGQPPQGWRVEELYADNVSLSVAVSQGVLRFDNASGVLADHTGVGVPGLVQVDMLDPDLACVFLEVLDEGV